MMNSDEHMEQMCVCMYVCACTGFVNASPAVLFSLCPSLTLLHPSGRRHPDSVNNADSNRLYRRSGPASAEMRRAEGVKEYPKNRGRGEGERERERETGRGIKEIQIQSVQRDGTPKRDWKYSEYLLSRLPLQLNTLFIINLQGDFVFHKLLSAAAVFSKQCQRSARLINRSL